MVMHQKTKLAIGVFLFVLLFFPLPKSNPETKFGFSEPKQVESILRRVCFDCHSNETKWPFYTYVFPASYLVYKHVEEGREELNFSDWDSFPEKKKVRLTNDIIEQIEEGEMPPWDYKLLHPSSLITKEELEILKEWANQKETL